MEYVFGSVSEVVVGIFLDSLGTRMVVVLIFAFAMIGGTGKGS